MFSNLNFKDQIKEKSNTTQEKKEENSSNIKEYITINNTTNGIKTNANIVTTKSNSNKISTKSTDQIQNKEVNVSKLSDADIGRWRIIIPAINLDAQISEGTSAEIMNKFVGHFENTSIWNGNVALAAHNRGYPVNYFARIKELKEGDIIEYYYDGNLRKYKVNLITVIADTDWSFLGSTKDNKITLITCVENEPEYRRCIQAIEV